MNKNFVLLLLFLSGLLSAQNPELKIYVDKKELDITNLPVSAWVKSGSKSYPILKTGGKTITLPAEINYQQIDALKFIVETDTLFFPVTKLLDQGNGQTFTKRKSDELNKIFLEIARWDLHIDHFKYFNEKEFLKDVKEGQKRTSVYSYYKIYALRTTNFTYYVVRDLKPTDEAKSSSVR